MKLSTAVRQVLPIQIRNRLGAEAAGGAKDVHVDLMLRDLRRLVQRAVLNSMLIVVLRSWRR